MPKHRGLPLSQEIPVRGSGMIFFTVSTGTGMSERSDEIPVRGSGMIFFTVSTGTGMSEQSDEIPVRGSTN